MINSFRPLAGDLSSLRCPKSCKNLMTLFPSPCRGLIFLTGQKGRGIQSCIWFPSPCRGLIFLTRTLENGQNHLKRFRPLAGDLSSLPRPRNTRVFVCFHCTLRGKKKISLSSSFFSCSTLAKWPIFSHRGKFL